MPTASPTSNLPTPLDDATLLRRAQTLFTGRRVVVVGDAILDCYRTPHGRSHCYAGGAAVIAGHLKQLGANPVLVTLTGQDGDSAQLHERLDALRLDHRALPLRSSLPLRIRRVEGTTITALAYPEQHIAPPPAETADRVASAVAELCGGLDAAIFVDFGYGTVTPALLDRLLPSLRPRVGVLAGDVSGPRASLLAMRRFDLLTPTESELRRLTPSPTTTPSLPAIGRRMQRELDLAHLLVTRDRRGCVRFDADGTQETLPSPAVRVVDEVGAGDALLAVATLALSCGFTAHQATRLGQRAAAAAVAQLGNAPIDWPRLHAAGQPVARVPEAVHVMPRAKPTPFAAA